MLRRGIVCGALLLAGVTAAPAGAHDGQVRQRPQFPALPSGKHARAVEARERGIEVSALGNEHAAEHAEGRSLSARMRRVMAAHAYGSGSFNKVLQPDNGLVPTSVGGAWSPGSPLPIVAINAIQLHTGKILYFAYPWRATEPDPDTGELYANGTPEQLARWNSADAYLFDPATGQSKAVPPPVNPDTGKQVELFCAGASLMADGRVLITGGNVGNPAGDGPNKSNYGLNTTYVFDPDVAAAGGNPWTETQRMRQGRWYPTQVLLPDGRTIITSGQANLGDPDQSQVNKDVDVFYPDGTIDRLTGFRLDGANGRPPTPGQYPHMTVMPSGDVLTWGPFKPDTWLMKQPAIGATSTTSTEVADLPTHREWAGGVQVPGTTAGSSKVLLIGGSDRTDTDHGPLSPALGSTTFYDESKPGQGWQDGPTLNVARAFANTVLMPNGKVAVVGGGLGDFNNTRYYRWTFSDAQKRVEILDPSNLSAAARPVLGNAQAEGRTYHSTALLLPDGRVWSGGDDINGPRANVDAPVYSEGPDFVAAQAHGGGSGVRTDTAEIWSPPYLFNPDGTAAARPQVVSAPKSVPYGSSFGVRTRGDVSKAVLVAPGASTHASDMSQRLVTLAEPDGVPGRGINLQAPSNANIAPPGYYMLFVLDADGTPSTSAWVRIDPAAKAASTLSASDAPTDPDAPTAPPGITGGNDNKTTTTTTKRLKVGVRFSLATTLQRLRRAKRFSLVVTVDRRAAVSVTSAVEVRRRVKVKGKRVSRTVAVPIAKTQKATLRKAGARRFRVTLSRAGRKLLRGRKSATLRVTVKAKPTTGKAVTVKRRPALR